MKKVLFFAFAILASLSSCQRMEEQQAPDAGGVRVFTAVIDQVTKTTIEIAETEGKIKWEETDVITVTDNSSKSAVYEVTAGAGTSSATFSLKDGESALGSGPYTAVYGSAPSTSVAQTYNPSNGASTALHMTASSADAASALKFTAQCGVMKLNLTDETHSVTKIQVSDGENEYTMNCTDAASISGGRDFFIALPAGTYTSVKVTASDNSVATKSPVSLQVTGGHIKPVTATSLTFVAAPTEYYLDKDGTHSDDPVQFTVSDDETGFKIELPSINWSNGGYLEFQMTTSGEGEKLTIGDGTAASWSNTFLYWDINGSNWIHATYVNNSTMDDRPVTKHGISNNSSPVHTYRISSSGLSYSSDGGNTWGTPAACSGLTSVSPLFFGLYGMKQAKDNSSTIKYIKISQGGGTSPDPEPVHAESVSLNHNSAAMAVGGETLTLTATLNPLDSTDEVEWSSTDEAVATVSGGVVTPVAAGTATITATAGTVHADCTVTVYSVSLNKASTSIAVGSTETLTATVSPSGSVSWSSSNTAVATVLNGVVTAVAAGSATITAKASDCEAAAATCTVTVTSGSISSGVIWYDKSGPHDSQPAPFDVKTSDDPPFKIAISDINWLRDSLEISLTHKGSTGSNGQNLTMGVDVSAESNPYGANYLYFVPNGTGATGNWWNINTSKYVSVVSGGDCASPIIRLVKDKIKYSVDGGTTWTAVSNVAVTNIQTLPTLYLETNGNNVDCTINYIKLCKTEGPIVYRDLVSVSLSNAEVRSGASVKLTPALNPTNADIAEADGYTWTCTPATGSSGTATVAANADGTATITGGNVGDVIVSLTVKDLSGNERTASCTVSVLESLAFNYHLESIEWNKGDQVEVSFTMPENSDNEYPIYLGRLFSGQEHKDGILQLTRPAWFYLTWADDRGQFYSIPPGAAGTVTLNFSTVGMMIKIGDGAWEEVSSGTSSTALQSILSYNDFYAVCTNPSNPVTVNYVKTIKAGGDNETGNVNAGGTITNNPITTW